MVKTEKLDQDATEIISEYEKKKKKRFIECDVIGM